MKKNEFVLSLQSKIPLLDFAPFILPSYPIKLLHVFIMKKELKEYSKPRMVMEEFEPNSYCVICEDKEIVSYTLKDPYPSYQHFVLDWNNDGICEESDLPHVQTTDNSQPEELEIQYAPALCWPSKKSNPTSLNDVLTYEPLWYAINPNNQSGHVYGYQTRIINYSHS